MSILWTRQTMQLYALSHIQLYWEYSDICRRLEITESMLEAMLDVCSCCSAPLIFSQKKVQFQYVVPICDYEKIYKNLQISALQIAVYWQIESTQTYCMHANVRFCIAESQTRGRGRRINRWHCAFGCGILFSYRVSVSLLFPAAVFAHLLSLQVVEWLRQLLPNLVYLKWPNDIWLDQAKVMGILVDRAVYSDHAVLIVGVGCNVCHPPESRSAWSALPMNVCGLDKTFVTLRLMQLCYQTTVLLEQFSFAQFIHRYNAVHRLHGCTFQFIYNKKKCVGVVRGVTVSGMLVICDISGKVVELYCAEHIASLREYEILDSVDKL